MDREFDPARYDRRLSGLRLVRTNRKVRGEVDGDRFLVTGVLELLELSAQNHLCDAERGHYPVHFNPIGLEDCVEADSLGIVLSLSERPR